LRGAETAGKTIMALINGDNRSGKMFDVVDEDGDLLGSFDEIGDAIDCGQAAPWWAGCVKIRRDHSLDAIRHARHKELKRLARLEFDYAA
jgi:hypothetical protein